MQECIAKYQSRDMHMRTSAKSKVKGCRKPTEQEEDTFLVSVEPT